MALAPLHPLINFVTVSTEDQRAIGSTLEDFADQQRNDSPGEVPALSGLPLKTKVSGITVNQTPTVSIQRFTQKLTEPLVGGGRQTNAAETAGTKSPPLLKHGLPKTQPPELNEVNLIPHYRCVRCIAGEAFPRNSPDQLGSHHEDARGSRGSAPLPPGLVISQMLQPQQARMIR